MKEYRTERTRTMTTHTRVKQKEGMLLTRKHGENENFLFFFSKETIFYKRQGFNMLKNI